MQITPTIQSILRSLAWRAKKYEKFWFSRHEYEKFWLTERTLRTLIRKFQDEKLIIKIDTETYMKEGKPRRRNIWKATQALLSLVQSFSESIKDMNEKIVNWCKNQNPVQILRDFGIEVFNGGRIGKKKSSITISKKNWAIKDWKTWKTYNLYNYLRESMNCTHSYFITNFIG
mgnify:FL=1